MSRVTISDVREQIQRLTFVYALPKGVQMGPLAEAWTEALEGVNPSEMQQAVGDYIRGGGTYFPKPSEIRRRVLETRQQHGAKKATDLRGRYYAWEQSHEGPCPVCGAVLQLYEGRYHVIHDYPEHQRQRVPHVGRPYPPAEAGA